MGSKTEVKVCANLESKARDLVASKDGTRDGEARFQALASHCAASIAQDYIRLSAEIEALKGELKRSERLALDMQMNAEFIGDEMSKVVRRLKSENAELRSALAQINAEELRSQRPGGGYSTSARISHAVLAKYDGSSK